LLIEGKNITLVGVTPADAPFILSLRLDEQRNRFLSPVSNDLEAQVAWIVSYLERQRQGEEYYFIITDKTGERLGTVRIYGFQDDAFSWGSWIIKPGSPSSVAIESALAVYEYAFGTLGFHRCYFEVRKGNERVVAFHTRFGARITGEDDLNNYFEVREADYLAVKSRYLKYLPSLQRS
jgi:RimJ/RimL family protein N-acetyltransferase